MLNMLCVGVVKDNVLKALEIMGYGVLAIFIVIAVLILIVKLMHFSENKSGTKKSESKYKSFFDKMGEKFIERAKKSGDEENITPKD